MNLLKLLEALGRKRVINDRLSDEPYLERYYLLFPPDCAIRKFFPFNVLLHHICRSDLDGFHDHPWVNASLILKGGYWEHTPSGKFWCGRWFFRVRGAKSLHRLEIDRGKANAETWTLFFVGTRVRDWGFIASTGEWVQWEKYLESIRRDRGA